MTTIYRFGNQPKGFAGLQESASVSAAMATRILLGQPSEKLWDPPPFRAHFKSGTSPPLGDNPYNSHYIIFSSRAVKYLENFFPSYAELLPISIIGGQSQKKSGVHYNVDLKECEQIHGIDDTYYILHISMVFTAKSGPIAPQSSAPLFEASDLFTALATKHQDPADLASLFLLVEPPPVFAYGTVPSIYVSDKFVSAIKVLGLQGFNFDVLTVVPECV